ncbi:hypothetical protein [Pseudomonas sp. P8_250]|uniref:hypothetical protein n=1 Tax=Pseudomonas sp. P8_250 TaxID=3043446 RepID=UPI002A365BFD|nr:hypothetical protein [Pseudomonas sp. P8_250]MDX9668738.1 hypothetical protein [Pseudomonas sp. P8_250]
MARKPIELCTRTRLIDGQVTYHTVSQDGKLMQVLEMRFRDYEADAVRTDTLYSKNDKLFRRDYKTVHFHLSAAQKVAAAPRGPLL